MDPGPPGNSSSSTIAPGMAISPCDVRRRRTTCEGSPRIGFGEGSWGDRFLGETKDSDPIGGAYLQRTGSSFQREGSMSRVALRKPFRNASVKCQAHVEGASDPLLVRCARGEVVERPAAWMMRQAGRYQRAYRELALKHPSFRVRSETTELIVEISLQPFKSFKPDGVILFSDILTPLDAFGVHFEIDDNKGPLIEDPIRSVEQLSRLHEIELEKLSFVGEALSNLRQEVGDAAAVLGFVGSPWTLATYIVEGKSTSLYRTIKCMARSNPEILHPLLDHLAEQIGTYCQFQIDSGAQCIQLFDSWGGQLTPSDWDKISRPYIEKIIKKVNLSHPTTPIVLYVNGSGGLLERMAGVGANVIGLDWTVDMADARSRIGSSSVQGNVDPCILFSSPESITEAVHECILKAGPTGHILNLGHGVLVGTPEENVGHFFDVNRAWSWEKAPSRV